MIPKPLDKIDAADILALVANGEEERRTMDFKRELPGDADRSKDEFRADVTSFANAGGGDLIFGVDEVGSVATAVPGLPDVNIDAEILRLHEVIQSRIDPRVPGCEVWPIPIEGQAPVIIVRVPRSWRGPHLVKFNDSFRMYGRTSKGKYIFDATEIRSAYALSEQLSERIRRWRDDRIATVMGGSPPLPLEDGARLFIHLIPLSSFTGSAGYSVGELIKQQLAFGPPDSGGGNDRINIDGIVSFAVGESNRNYTYCQLFRSGIVEAVSTSIVHVNKGLRYVASVAYEKWTMAAVASYLKGLKQLGVPLPIAVLMSIAGANGAIFAVSARFRARPESTIDRAMVMLPDVLVESYDVEVQTLLRPIFDAVWNAAGWERSFNYDEHGKWAPRN